MRLVSIDGHWLMIVIVQEEQAQEEEVVEEPEASRDLEVRTRANADRYRLNETLTNFALVFVLYVGENHAVWSAISADEPGKALLHTIQRVPQVPSRKGRRRGGMRTVGEVLQIYLPDGMDGKVEWGTRGWHVAGSILNWWILEMYKHKWLAKSSFAFGMSFVMQAERGDFYTHVATRAR
jgi:hypothetical protein